MRVRLLAGCVALALSASFSVGQVAEDCSRSYRGNPSLTAGQDAQGFFVRAHWSVDFFATRRGDNIRWVADTLAKGAGAVVLFQTEHTTVDVPQGEWRAATPFECLKEFLAAGGLDLDVTAEGVWVVSSADTREATWTRIMIRPYAPDLQPVGGTKAREELDQAILRQLPVRRGCDRLSVCTIDISYLWLPDEAPDLLLVHYSRPLGNDVLAPSEKLFKVRLTTTASGIELSCLWVREAFLGQLIPEVAEDLDGDGVRDFVFVDLEYDDHGDRVVSGATGQDILRFWGPDLVIEKRESGPAKVAVRELFKFLLPADKINAPPPTPGPVVATFSAEEAKFVKVPEASASSTAQRAARTPPDNPNPAAALGPLVGGTDRLRRYCLYRSPSPAKPVGEEVITVGNILDRSLVMARKAPGFAGRIVLEYKPRGNPTL